MLGGMCATGQPRLLQRKEWHPRAARSSSSRSQPSSFRLAARLETTVEQAISFTTMCNVAWLHPARPRARKSAMDGAIDAAPLMATARSERASAVRWACSTAGTTTVMRRSVSAGTSTTTTARGNRGSSREHSSSNNVCKRWLSDIQERSRGSPLSRHPLHFAG